MINAQYLEDLLLVNAHAESIRLIANKIASETGYLRNEVSCQKHIKQFYDTQLTCLTKLTELLASACKKIEQYN